MKNKAIKNNFHFWRAFLLSSDDFLCREWRALLGSTLPGNMQKDRVTHCYTSRGGKQRKRRVCIGSEAGFGRLTYGKCLRPCAQPSPEPVFLILFSGWNVNWKIEKGLQKIVPLLDSLQAF